MTFRSGPPGTGFRSVRRLAGRPRRTRSDRDSTSSAAPAPAVPPQDPPPSPDRREALVHRVRAEFFEMPGMRLTLAQAQRLFGLPNDLCEWILAELTREGFLFRAQNGMFARREFSRG